MGFTAADRAKATKVRKQKARERREATAQEWGVTPGQVAVIMKLPDRYRRFASGELPVSQLDMEELERGMLRDVDGKFHGRPPTSLPLKFYQAMRAEYQRRLEEEMRPLMRDAYAALKDVATGKGQAGVARVNAAKELLDRLGQPVGKELDVRVSGEIKAKYELVMEGVEIDLLSAPAQLENVVDAEIVEDGQEMDL